MTFDRAQRALLVGSNGGVGRAVLSLLEKSDPGRRLRQSFEKLVLVDAAEAKAPVAIENAVTLPPTAIQSADDLGRLVREHQITQVIDLSSVDTVDCMQICEELDSDFLCTSVEEWPERGSIPTDEAIKRLLPPHRPALKARSHLVGSGANPGIVNSLVFGAIEEFARRVDVEPTAEALGLHTVLITEEDTTVELGATYGTDVFPMTWSPAHCLEELFEPRSFAARKGKVVELGHAPTERLYRARCGDRLIDGMAVPHEETATLAWRLPNVEIAFIYRIAPAARTALATHPEWSSADWRTHRLVPPNSVALRGKDRVGVLLCSRRFGELWMGFDTDVAKGLSLGTNATQLQVAAGVVAGWSQLGARKGVHFVEDLDWRQFLDVARQVLGPTTVVHDAKAPSLELRERAVIDTVPVAAAALQIGPSVPAARPQLRHATRRGPSMEPSRQRRAL